MKLFIEQSSFHFSLLWLPMTKQDQKIQCTSIDQDIPWEHPWHLVFVKIKIAYNQHLNSFSFKCNLHNIMGYSILNIFIYFLDRTTPYVIALVLAKFLHTFGLYVAYEQLKVVRVVQFLFIIRLWFVMFTYDMGLWIVTYMHTCIFINPSSWKLS